MRTAKRLLAFALVFLMLFGELGSPIAMAANAGGDPAVTGAQTPEPKAEETENEEEASGAGSTQSYVEHSSDEASETAPAEEAPAAPAEEPVEGAPAEAAPAAEPAASEPAASEPAAMSLNEDYGIMPIALADSYPVYIYLTFTGNGAADFNARYNNGTGFVTFGVINVPSENLPTYDAIIPSNDGTADPATWYDNNWHNHANGGVNAPDNHGAVDYIKGHFNGISIYSGNNTVKDLNLDYTSINWPDNLRACANAAGYPEAGKCWHLDITIDVPKPQATITVKFQDEGGQELHSDKLETFNVGTAYDANALLEKIDGYVFDHFEGPANGVAYRDVTVTAVYATDKNHNGTADKNERYTVTYSTTGRDGYATPGPDTVTGYETKYTVRSVPADETTKDQYENVTGTWTFDGWYLDGRKVTELTVTKDVTLTGEWKFTSQDVPSHKVTYEWTGLPEDRTDLPELPEVKSYVPNQPYAVDTEHRAGETYQVKDKFDNVLQEYTFSGWSLSGEQKMGNADVTITGTWRQTVNLTEEHYQHTVTYNATGDVPEGYTAPETKTYTEGESYTVEAVPDVSEYTVTDDFKNVLKQYSFDGWSLSGEQKMGNADVTITGTWKRTVNLTAADYQHEVTYTFEGNIPPAEKVSEPASEIRSENETFDLPDVTAKVADLDKYENVVGTWTFEGWYLNGVKAEGLRTMGSESVTYTGKWTYTVRPESEYKHRVIYSWTGLPDGAEIELPVDVTLYAKGAKYPVNSTYSNATILELDGGLYVFSGWTDPNSGVMGDTDVTVNGTWAALPAPTWDTFAGRFSMEIQDTAKKHGNKTYLLDKTNTTIGDIYKTEGGHYAVDLTINMEPIVNQYNAEVNQRHRVGTPSVETKTILYYTKAETGAEAAGWYAPSVGSEESNFSKATTWTYNVSCMFTVVFNDGANKDVFAQQSYTVMYDTIDDLETLFNTCAEAKRADVDASGKPLRDGFAFTGWEEKDTDTSVKFNAQWAPDENGDGIADNTQTVVIKIVGNTATLPYNGGRQEVNGIKSVEATVNNAPVNGVTAIVTEGKDHADGITADKYFMNLDEDDFTVSGTDGYAGYTLDITDGWLEIIKAAADAYTAGVTMEGWTWGDEPKSPLTEGPNGPGAGNYGTPTFSYSKDGKSWTDKIPAEAGSYTVKATWEGNKSLPELTAEASFTIERKFVNIKAYAERNYNGERQTFTAEAKDFTVVDPNVWIDGNPAVLEGWTVEEILQDSYDGEKWTEVSAGPNVWDRDGASKSMGITSYVTNTSDVVIYRDGVNITDNLEINANVALDLRPITAKVTPLNATKVYGENDPLPFGYTVSDLAKDPDQTFVDAFERANVKLVREEDEKVGEYELYFEQNGYKQTYIPAGEGNYNIQLGTGIFTIEKAAADAYTSSVEIADWTYGEPASAPTAEVTGGPGAADYGNPTFSYSADGKTWDIEAPTDAGSYKVKASWAGTTNLPELEATKDFKIAKRSILLYTDNSGSHYTYDGEAHTVAATADNLKSYTADPIDNTGKYMPMVEGDKLVFVSENTLKLTLTNYAVGHYQAIDGAVGKTEYVKIVNEADKDVTANYTGRIAVRLWIDPRPVTLTSERLEKVYDGKPLTNGETPVKGLEGFVTGEGVDITFTGSRTLVGGEGLHENKFNFKATSGTDLNNYKITTVFGDLVVTDRPENDKLAIELQPKGDTVPYNGGRQEVEGFETLSFVIDGVSYTVNGVSASASGTEPGRYPVKVDLDDAVVLDADGNDVTAQFEVTSEDAELVIDPMITVAVENGTADPAADDVQVAYEGDQTITFTPNDGYALESVTVDGEPAALAADGSYTFEGVAGNHSIVVVFSADSDGDGTPDATETNDITVTVTGGTADPAESPIEVAYGEDQTITFTANAGNALESVTVDGEPAALAADGSYTFEDVADNHSIVVVFSADSDGDGVADVNETNDITVTVTNGTAAPAGSPITVAFGEDQTITFTAAAGNALESVTVDGAAAALTAAGAYTFTNVTAPHSIVVVFSADADGDGVADVNETNNITVTVTGGTAAPAVNPITVAYGANQTITFTANAGNALESVTVDGAAAALTAAGAYTFTNVTAPHNIVVVFSADANGNGIADVNEPAVIDDNPVPLAPGPQDLQVNENGEVTIDQDETPLAAAPTVEQCCILHLIIMLCALAVTLYYTYDRKKRQKEEFETRSQLL